MHGAKVKIVNYTLKIIGFRKKKKKIKLEGHIHIHNCTNDFNNVLLITLEFSDRFCFL